MDRSEFLHLSFSVKAPMFGVEVFQVRLIKSNADLPNIDSLKLKC